MVFARTRLRARTMIVLVVIALATSCGGSATNDAQDRGEHSAGGRSLRGGDSDGGSAGAGGAEHTPEPTVGPVVIELTNDTTEAWAFLTSGWYCLNVEVWAPGFASPRNVVRGDEPWDEGGCDDFEIGAFEVLDPGESVTFVTDGEVRVTEGTPFEFRFGFQSPSYSSDVERWVTCDSDWTSLCASEQSGLVELSVETSDGEQHVSVLASEIIEGAPAGGEDFP